MSGFFEPTLVHFKYETIEEFIKAYNKHRLEDKKRWYGYSGIVDGMFVQIKSHGTWNQILRINGIKYNTLMDQKVGAWKKEIAEALEYAKNSK